MAEAEYDVVADLRIDARKALGATAKLGNRVERLSHLVRGSSGAFNGLFSQIVAFGGAYVAINAVKNAFVGTTRAAADFHGELEKTSISLNAVLMATQGSISSMEQAGVVGQAVYRQLQKDAVTSVATTRDMFEIYQAILGPMSKAGASLAKVRDLTNDTVAAATVLNVDLAQAQRDMAMMATGAAGVDVKLFRMLRATGAIAEDTKTFNELAPEKRLKVIGEALATFREAAGGFGRTLPGRVSTFTDIIQQLRAAFAGEAIRRFSNFLGALNDRLQANFTQIKAVLMVLGTRFAAVLSVVFDNIIDGFDYIQRNWRPIVAATASAFDAMYSGAVRLFDYVRNNWSDIQAAMSKAAQFAKIAAIVTVGRAVAAPILGAAGTALSAVGGIAGASGATAAAAGAVGAAGAATGAGAAGTAAGAAGAVAGGGFLAKVLSGAAWAGLEVSLASVLAVVGALAASIGVFVVSNLEPLGRAFDSLKPVFADLWVTSVELAKAVGSMLWVALKAVGSLIGGALGVALLGLLAILRVTTPLIVAMARAIQWVASVINDYFIQPVSRAIAEFIAWLARMVSKIPGVSAVFGQVEALQLEWPKTQEPSIFDEIEAALAKFKLEDQQSERALAATPTERAQTVNDFRGSRIEVKQDFRQADPDRVWLQMLEGLNTAAERRTQSSLVPDFTR